MKAQRISAPVVREKVMNDSALLICAYGDDDKFRKYHLEGAISLDEFKSKTNNLDKSREIFFYEFTIPGVEK